MSFLFFSSFSLSLSSFLSFYLSFFFSPLYPFSLRAIALRAIARVATLPNFSATLVSASHGPGLFHVVNSIDAINECQSLTKGYARNIGIFSSPRFFHFILCSSFCTTLQNWRRLFFLLYHQVTYPRTEPTVGQAHRIFFARANTQHRDSTGSSDTLDKQTAVKKNIFGSSFWDRKSPCPKLANITQVHFTRNSP